MQVLLDESKNFCRSEREYSMPTTTELHASRCARITLTQDEGLPRLHLVALGDAMIDDATIDRVLALTDALLDEGKSFESLWDLRACRVPMLPIVARCIKWTLTRKTRLDALNRRMAIVMPNRPALLAVVRLVLRAFGPVCPVKVSEDEAQCEAFMLANA